MKTDVRELRQQVARLDTKIEGVDQRLSSKIDGVDQRLSAKIDAVDKTLSDKIDDVKKGVGDLRVAMERSFKKAERLSYGLYFGLEVACYLS